MTVRGEPTDRSVWRLVRRIRNLPALVLHRLRRERAVRRARRTDPNNYPMW